MKYRPDFFLLLLLLLFLQEFIPSSPALHTGIALCTGCPCARTTQPQDQQVSSLSSSHATCPRLGARLTVSLSPPSCVASNRGWRTTGTHMFSRISELPLLGAAGEKSKHGGQPLWYKSLGGDPSEASFSSIDPSLDV